MHNLSAQNLSQLHSPIRVIQQQWGRGEGEATSISAKPWPGRRAPARRAGVWTFSPGFAVPDLVAEQRYEISRRIQSPVAATVRCGRRVKEGNTTRLAGDGSLRKLWPWFMKRVSSLCSRIGSWDRRALVTPVFQPARLAEWKIGVAVPRFTIRIDALLRLALGAALLLSGRQTALSQTSPAGSAAAAPMAFHPEKLAEMDAAIRQSVADRQCPGAVLWLERNGAEYHHAYGRRALVPVEELMTEDTIFDAASLTKVIACTPAVMLLIERGRIELDGRVQAYIPEFSGEGKEAITIRQLLTHTSGLRPDISTQPPWSGYDTAIRMACAEKPLAPPGTSFRYSDINFFLLGEVVRRVSGSKLNEFVAREIYQPLKMSETGYLPDASRLPRIAPTEKVGTNILRGTVHDPTARYMGGVAGHAPRLPPSARLAPRSPWLP